jgi:hypothetical protein
VFAISIQTQAKIFPTHLARRSRDLPTNDKNGLPSRKRFSRNEVLEKSNQALSRLRSLGYADHSTDYSDPIVAWRSAHLAIQHWLGLLPKRRTGINFADRGNPRLDGATVTSETSA